MIRLKTAGYHKYGAKRVTHAGMSFASKLEAALYDHLVFLASAGELSDIRCQPHVFLTSARIEYIVDFSALDVKSGELTFYEAKGFETAVWRIKRKLWTHYGSGPLHVYKGRPGSLKLVEVVRVKS